VNERIVLLGCGDVGPIDGPLETYAEHARPILAAADLRFAQCERVYSTRGVPRERGSDGHSRLDPSMAAIFSDCGFDVVSLASNHAMDWGAEALLDTIDVLRGQGIAVVGAGGDLAAARAPVVIERKGVRVAFVAYCSVLREGYAAGIGKPGVAPLRVHTRYEAAEYQPGMPPRVVTEPHAEDLAHLVEDVRGIRSQVNAVVVSLHWGLHFIPRAIADYQPVVARAAFDAGADLILGHHAHVPKAIASMGGKTCFYSLSNFIMSAPPASDERRRTFARRYGVALDADYPNLPYGVDAKRSLMARAVIGHAGVERVSFLPVQIDRQLRPEVLRGSDPRFDDAVRYMAWASEDFPHRFVRDGDEVVVEAPAA
jgi:poly-gamma-glutamate synthesis protein (capsule biosynthesis protein)